MAWRWVRGALSRPLSRVANSSSCHSACGSCSLAAPEAGVASARDGGSSCTGLACGASSCQSRRSVGRAIGAVYRVQRTRRCPRMIRRPSACSSAKLSRANRRTSPKYWAITVSTAGSAPPRVRAEPGSPSGAISLWSDPSHAGGFGGNVRSTSSNARVGAWASWDARVRRTACGACRRGAHGARLSRVVCMQSWHRETPPVVEIPGSRLGDTPPLDGASPGGHS